MSILGMTKEYLRRQMWAELKNHPEKRDEIRRAARAVLDAENDVAEFRAIVRLAKVLP